MDNLPWVTALIALSILNTILGRSGPRTAGEDPGVPEVLRRAETDLAWFIGVANDQKARLFAVNGLLVVLSAFQFSDIVWLRELADGKPNMWFTGFECGLGVMIAVSFFAIVSNFGYDAPALNRFNQMLEQDRLVAIARTKADIMVAYRRNAELIDRKEKVARWTTYGTTIVLAATGLVLEQHVIVHTSRLVAHFMVK